MFHRDPSLGGDGGMDTDFLQQNVWETASPSIRVKAGRGQRRGARSGGLIACRTRFFDSELAAIYDYLTDLARDPSLRLIVTNSFGRLTAVCRRRPNFP